MSWKSIIFILFLIFLLTIYTGYKFGCWLVNNAPISSSLNIDYENNLLLDANENYYIEPPPQPLSYGTLNTHKSRKNNNLVNTLDLSN